MSKLQILDLSSNRLRILPSSIGLLASLRTLLIHGNPLDEATSLLAAPLIRSYANISPEVHSRGLQMNRHPGQGYLSRLQGQLADQYDLDLKQIIKQREKPTRSKLEEFKATFSAQHVDYTHCMIPKSITIEDSQIRMRVVAEILETEATYVDQLSALLELYYVPLQPILSRSEMDLVFSNIRVIHHIHSRYLFLTSIIYPALVALAASHGQPMGQFFSSACTVLQVYSEYMNNYDYSARFIEFLSSSNGRQPSLLTGFMKEEKVLSFMKVLENAKAHPKHTQINLISFLILPVQRLPRYQLLLSSLLKETAKGNPDHPKLTKAIEDVQSLIEYCNEMKRECGNKAETLLPLTKIIIQQSTRLLKSYRPCPDRKLLYTSDSLLILKYVDHVESDPILKPTLLCKAKKSQLSYQQKGTIKEWKFKMNKDSTQSKIARLIEEGGAASKYDVANILGKKCTLFLCNDMMLISNSSDQLCGLIHFNFQTAVSCLPLIISREAKEGVLRLSNGDGILYIRGTLEEVTRLVALVNSLL